MRSALTTSGRPGRPQRVRAAAPLLVLAVASVGLAPAAQGTTAGTEPDPADRVVTEPATAAVRTIEGPDGRQVAVPPGFPAQHLAALEAEAGSAADGTVRAAELPGSESTTGSITGTVTGPGGTLLPYGTVLAYNDVDYGTGWLAEDGSYSVSDLDPGSYTVHFAPSVSHEEDPDTPGNNVAEEYWRDAPTEDLATPVTVTAGETVPGVDAELPLGAIIRGRVTVAGGAPVITTVEVRPVSSPYGYYTSTAEDGTFVVGRLPAGPYLVRFDAAYEWETDRYLAPEYWADAGTRLSATPVQTAAGSTVTGVDAVLEPAARLTGHVRDAAGNPVEGVWADVYDRAGDVVAGHQSEVDGSYDIDRLRAGTVTVGFARASGKTPYVGQFFTGGEGPDGDVVLRSGQVTGGVDVVLRTGASISGRLTDGSGAPVAGVEMRAILDREDTLVPNRGGVTEADGTYVIEGLLPGAYNVAAATWVGDWDGSDWWYGSGLAEPAEPNVVVWGTGTVSGVDIVMDGARQPGFSDVGPGMSFFEDIQWLREQGISQGNLQADGSWTFDSAAPVRRDAMAAFLYRSAGSPAYTPPTVSPFADLTASSTFYREISWLAAQGISQGYVAADGTRTYRPDEPVSREAMAAFLYRSQGSPAFTVPPASAFEDLVPSSRFYREIAWLAASGISNGYLTATGKEYRPGESVRREAMAAFLHRVSRLP